MITLLINVLLINVLLINVLLINVLLTYSLPAAYRLLPPAACLYGQNACCQYRSLLDLTRQAVGAAILQLALRMLV